MDHLLIITNVNLKTCWIDELLYFSTKRFNFLCQEKILHQFLRKMLAGITTNFLNGSIKKFNNRYNAHKYWFTQLYIECTHYAPKSNNNNNNNNKTTLYVLDAHFDLVKTRRRDVFYTFITIQNYILKNFQRQHWNGW